VTSEDFAGEALLFGDEVEQPVEGHLLDRLVHHSIILEFIGESHRTPKRRERKTPA
jgi:hypothetical protein